MSEWIKTHKLSWEYKKNDSRYFVLKIMCTGMYSYFISK